MIIFYILDRLFWTTPEMKFISFCQQWKVMQKEILLWWVETSFRVSFKHPLTLIKSYSKRRNFNSWMITAIFLILLQLFDKLTASNVTENCKPPSTGKHRPLTLKRLGVVNLTPSPLPRFGFSKSVSSKERVKPWFFVTFNIILRHIFPENFIEFPQVVQKIWRNSLSILANFHQFSSIFWFFWHYLLAKKTIDVSL